MALFRNDSDQPLEIPAADLHVAPHASFVVTEDWVIEGLAAQPLVTRLDGAAPAAGPADAEPEPATEPEPAAEAVPAVPAAAAPLEVDAAEGDDTVHDFTA